MTTGLRRFGRAILAWSEVVLAASGLVTVWMLTDISRGVERGVYQAAASGYATAFRALWLLAFLVLALVLVIDTAIWALRLVDTDGFDALRERLPRFGLELVTAAFLSVVVLNVGIASSTFEVALAASATLGVWVLLHHTATAVGAARRMAASP